MDNFQTHISILPGNPRAATMKLLNNILLDEIHPIVIRIRNRSEFWIQNKESTSKVLEMYTICISQIKKCVLNLFEIFRLEFKEHMLLQESRQCNLERLSWCCNRLVSIDNYLKKRENFQEFSDTTIDDSLNVTVMYFVNWIDHAFEVLNKLAEAVYKTDYKATEEMFEEWKNCVVECISTLHLCIDELLLSAMTLCRYCLPSDQVVVKARCQVVLRETKALISELIEGDLSTTVKATSEALKLPVMPSNISVTIDVLKDVLYVLETNTNTALLTVLIHCFSTSVSPIDALKKHFQDSKNGCSCTTENANDAVEDCLYVNEFDLYNERLLQIGLFAVSCSSDQKRIPSLQSGLASLEALDPHLVPALMTSPDGRHSTLLINSWRREVEEIRNSVFLIVDPAAFADKCRQMMHQKLQEVLKQSVYGNAEVCAVVDVACALLDFFHTYNEHEPQALPQRDQLSLLLDDLSKVQLECKVVSNLFCSSKDFKYEAITPTKKEATLDQLYKRLKLLYTLVKRINTLLQPKDLFDEEEVKLQDVTHTIVKIGQTYQKPPAAKANMTRSIFARTNVRSSTRNFALSKLTKHLQSKNCSQLNFSVELDRLFDVSSEKGTFTKGNKLLDRVRETSVLYTFSPVKNRSSMRKAVLKRMCKLDAAANDNICESGAERETLMDENESLQLTEVLNELNDMTSILNTSSAGAFDHTRAKARDAETDNVLRIDIDNRNETVSKPIWNIPVNCTDETAENEPFMMSDASNVTQPSNITTSERIDDLDFVETKLNSLKSRLESSL